MPRQVYVYENPERFIAGAVGQPGSRTFFLQARAGLRMTSVVAEKRQVSVLAERLNELLDEVARRGDQDPALAMAGEGEATLDNGPLETPIDEEFRVGTMSLSWDPEDERVVIECFADDDDALGEDEEAVTGAVLRVRIASSSARAFAQRALAVVAAGRPPCPFCDGPLDPEGHICPRSNGYRR